jgi:dihydrofolate reductase
MGLDEMGDAGMTDIKIALVVAAARNGVIGIHNSLPWNLPSDLKRFKELTTGHPVIMGRNTYEAIGKPLADRDNIVLTRGEIMDDPSVHTVNSIEEAVALAKRFAVNRGVDEVMVVGGGQIYEQTLPLADRIYFTRVEMDAQGDTLFPDLSPGRWREISREEIKAGPEDNADFTILTLDRAA